MEAEEQVKLRLPFDKHCSRKPMKIFFVICNLKLERIFEIDMDAIWKPSKIYVC